ncbi:DNA recombination protein RmuC, partial [bacterium]|nr:DNA recombination protein RmuC [bacterium]
MSGIVILVIGLLILILQILIIMKIRKSTDANLATEIKEQKDKIVAFESKLDLFPELLKSKIAESIQEQFTNFTQRIMSQIQELVEKFGVFRTDITKSLAESSLKTSTDLTTFKELFQKSLSGDFEKLTTNVEKKLDAINNKVQENLSEGFKKTNETFNNVIERLTKIDEAQKKIDSLSTNVVSLQDILTDKKSRGIFGEVQLNQILYAVFGEKNDKVY